LGPLTIRCDAPPYTVVWVCKGLGFKSPLDVGWCRMSNVNNRTSLRYSSFGSALWQLLFGTSNPKEKACACGEPLPDLKHYHFAFNSKKGSDYLLGQCRRCRTIFWDVAVPLSVRMNDRILG